MVEMEKMRNKLAIDNDSFVKTNNDTNVIGLQLCYVSKWKNS